MIVGNTDCIAQNFFIIHKKWEKKRKIRKKLMTQMLNYFFLQNVLSNIFLRGLTLF